jgi:hypothetical protein
MTKVTAVNFLKGSTNINQANADIQGVVAPIIAFLAKDDFREWHNAKKDDGHTITITNDVEWVIGMNNRSRRGRRYLWVNCKVVGRTVQIYAGERFLQLSLAAAELINIPELEYLMKGIQERVPNITKEFAPISAAAAWWD